LPRRERHLPFPPHHPSRVLVEAASLAEAGKEDARFSLQKRIQALDYEIDARVYSLYGLTEAEIKLVERK
jgi:hypothetical protein